MSGDWICHEFIDTGKCGHSDAEHDAPTDTAPEPREDVAVAEVGLTDAEWTRLRHAAGNRGDLGPIAEEVERIIAERVRAAAVEVIDEVQRVFDMQCPPSLPDTYVDRGAWMAHSWWNTVLGATLRNLRDRADRRAER